MSLDDFLSHGEARVLWSRFESLVGQQVFRLRVEGEAANVPSSLCSLLSCNMSSPERMTQFEPNCMQPGHLQRNSNALEIDKQPLYGLPYIAQSSCPLLSLILVNMQELRSLEQYLDPYEALRRVRKIKRSLIDVHKKALLLESQLHQYINPTLVTTLSKRSAKATYEAELMSKLIDKLRKDSRQSALEPEKRKRVCELTMRLKSLLCRQKCEWQCVGRLKETIAIARDMKGVLKFICQLSCLLEHCSEASRRLPERPPPYEFCSPYDSVSKEDSCDAFYEDLKLLENQCPPYQSQSSQSQVTISLSLDFTSDPEFEGRSPSSGDSTCTRTSSYRHRSRSCSRDYTDVKSDSEPATLSSRRHSRDYTDAKKDLDAATSRSRRRSREYTSVKSDSDPGTLSSRKHSREYIDAKKDINAATSRSRRRSREYIGVKSDSDLGTLSPRKHSREYIDAKKDIDAATSRSRRRSREYIGVKSDSDPGTLSPRRRSRDYSVVKSDSGATTVSSRRHSRGYSDAKSSSGGKTVSSRRHSRDYSDVKSDSGATNVSSRKRSKAYSDVKSESGATTESSRKRRKTRHDSTPTEAKISKSQIRRAKSASSFSSRSSGRRSRKSLEPEGKASSRHQTVLVPSMMEASADTYDIPKNMYSRATRSVSPVKSASPRERMLSKNLAEETLNELIEVLEDYIENKSETRSGDVSQSEPTSRQTFHVHSSLRSESPSHRQWSKVSPVIPDRPSSASVSPTAWERSAMLEAQNDLQDLHTLSRHSFNKDFSSGQGWSSVTPQKSEVRHSLKDSRLSQQTFDGGRMSSQGLDEMRISNDDLQGSQQNLNDVKISRNSLNEPRLSRQNFSDARMSSPDFKSSLSKQNELVVKNMPRVSQDYSQTRTSQGELSFTGISKPGETKTSRHSVGEARTSRHSFGEARISRDSVGEARTSRHSVGEARISRDSVGEARTSRHSVGEARTSRDSVGEARTSRHSVGEARTSRHSVGEARTSRHSVGEARTSRHSVGEARTSRDSVGEARTSRDSVGEARTSRHSVGEARTSRHSVGEARTSRDSVGEARTSRHSVGEARTSRDSVGEAKTSKDSVGEARISQEQARASQSDYLKAKVSQENMDDSSQTKSSQRDAKFSRSGKMNSEGTRKSMEDHSDKASTRGSDHSKMVNNVSDRKPSNCLCDELRRSRKSMNGNDLGEMIGKRRTNDEHGLVKTRRGGKDSDLTEMSSVQRERQRQLARECADVVRRRIASISPPSSGSKHTQLSRPCASSSPSHVRRGIDKICSRFEKGSLDNSEATDTKNTSELSAHSKKKLSKIINSPLSVISESKDYPSSNTEIQEPEQDMETNNMEDVSTNKNVSDPRRGDSFDCLPEQLVEIRMSQDKFRQKRTSPHFRPRKSVDREFYMQPRCDNSDSFDLYRQEEKRKSPHLTPRKSEDREFYMQPRCDNSDSSGSRDPLLFSSQETNFSCDDIDDDNVDDCDCSELSYKPPHVVNKHRKKVSKGKRMKRKKSFAEMEADLLADTTTTTDSCAYDERSTSLSSHRSYSGRQQSPRIHQMDDTEGDIDQESDFEVELELELQGSPLESIDKEAEHHSPELSRRWDRKSSVHPTKSDSYHSRRSASQSSHQPSSVNESSSLGDQRTLSPWQGSGQSRRRSSPKSPFHKHDEETTSLLKQSINELYAQQPYLSPSIDQLSENEDLRLADSLLRQSPYETDLRASDLAFGKSPAISQKYSKDASYTHSQAGSRRSSGKPASLHSPYRGEDSPFSEPSQMSVRSIIKRAQSLMQSEHAASLHTSTPRQKSPSPTPQTSAKVSSVLTQPQSPGALTQSPPYDIPIASSLHGSSLRFASSEASQRLRSPSASSIYPAGSLQGYPCEYAISGTGSPAPVYQGGSVYAYASEYATSKAGTPTSVYPDGSVHGYPSAEAEPPQMLPSTPGLLSRGTSKSGSAASYQAGSKHGYPSAVSEHAHSLPSTPGISSYHASRVCSPAASYPAGSVHGYPSAVSGHPQTLPSTPRSSSHHASRVCSPAASYQAGSVHSGSMHGYPAVSEHPQTLPSTPGSLSHHPSKAGSSAASYPAGSVHGYPSAVSEQPQMLPSDSGIPSHYASVTGSSAATYPGGSAYEHHSAISEHPQTLPPTPGSSGHGPSKAGSSASYPAGSVHEYPSAVSEHPQTLLSVLESSGHGPSKAGSSAASYPAGSVHEYPSAISEHPKMLPSDSGIPSHYASATGSSAAMYPGGSVHEYHSAVSGHPQTLPSAPGSSSHPASMAGSVASYPAGSVHRYPSAVSEQPKMLPSTSGTSSHRTSVTFSPDALHPAGSGHESAVSEQPQILVSPPGTSAHHASRAGSPASSHPDGSVHGYPSAVSEQPQMLTTTSGVPSHYASVTGSSAAMYPGGSVHEYHSTVSGGSVHGYPSAVSEHPKMLPSDSGIPSHYTSATGSSAAMYPGGSVHEYHSAVSGHPQTLPSAPGSSSHPASMAGSVASYPVRSVHEYPSAVSEQPKMLPSVTVASIADSAASHPDGSIHGSEHPQMLPSVTVASKAGSAASHPDGSVHRYPSTVSEHPQMLPSTSVPSVQGYPSTVSEHPQMLPSTSAPSVQGYPSTVSEHPQMLPSTSGISSHPASVALSLDASGISVHGYLSAEQPASRTHSSAASYQAGSVPGYPSALPEQPQISSTTGASLHGISNAGSTAAAGSVHGYPSAVSELPQIRTLTPGISEHSSKKIGSPAPISPGASTHGYPSVASELPELPSVAGTSTHDTRAGSPAASYPGGSVHLSFVSQQPHMLPSYITASVHADSSAPSGLPETLPLASRVSQQTSKLSEQSVLTARSPSVHPAGSVRSALGQPTDFADELQQETARSSQAGQHMDSGVRQSRYSAISDVSRHSPYQAGASETPRHTPFLSETSGASVRSPSPADITGASGHSSDYSYASRHSPSKSLRPSVTPKSITSEEADMSTDYIQDEVSRSSTRASSPRSSLSKRQMSMKDNVQERYEEEEYDSQLALATSSAHVRDSELESREKWWMYVPLVIIALILLYYIICYLASTGDCMNCRAPFPNIFFYLINSAVHSVRLIHASPAPT